MTRREGGGGGAISVSGEMKRNYEASIGENIKLVGLVFQFCFSDVFEGNKVTKLLFHQAR